MKSTIRYVYVFARTLLNFKFPAITSVLFFILWHISHPSIYFPTFFVTSGYQQFLITNFIIFHFPLCSATGISWCNWIISTLNSSSLGTYTFLSFNTNFLSIYYSFSYNIFTSVFFIYFTILTISLFLLLAFFKIFFTIFVSSPSITTLYKLCSQQSLINT